MKGKFTLIAALLANTIALTYAAPDPNFHIYLAFGQSNMEGQGPIEAQDKTVDSRFKMLSTVDGCNNRSLGEWYEAIPPLANCDGRLGPVDYFGRTLVKKLPEQIKVGAVVVAVAGCDIQLFEKDNYIEYSKEQPDWMVGRINAYGGNPYGRLVDMAKKAQEVGVIKGILFHQGETNNGQVTWPSRVKAVYNDLLSDLGLKAENVPLLAGEVVPESVNGLCAAMNDIIKTLPETIPTAHVISSEGLEPQDDNLHFSSAAYRTFGERYAETMLELLGDVEVVDNTTECWSEKLGYSCCSENNTRVVLTDDDGKWGAENGEWCGIRANPAAETCWSIELGYPCCSTSECKVVYEEDDDGKWGAENNDWCGITSENTIC
jgi:hypothetical protein